MNFIDSFEQLIRSDSSGGQSEECQWKQGIDTQALIVEESEKENYDLFFV